MRKMEEINPKIRKLLYEISKRNDKLIEEGKIKPINPRTALKNSLFTTLVKKATKS